ncbi:MAG: rod shape-determining protein MreC, partial [Terriglobia bacterium]
VGRHLPFFVLIVVLLAQLLFLAYQATRNQHERLLQVWAVGAFAPFERSLHGLTQITIGAWDFFYDLSQARRENQQLSGELTRARARILQLSEADVENARLRELLDLEQRLPYRATAATVIAASPGTDSAIFIDKGADAGLAAEMPVITPQGIVGKTIAVFRHTAEVLTITDSSSGVGSMLEKSETDGVVKGTGEGLCQLNYIMNEDQVAQGDLIVTSGLDQIYPRGLLVGAVRHVSNGAVYKYITVKPAAALDRLENVLVILGPSNARQRPEARHAHHRN